MQYISIFLYKIILKQLCNFSKESEKSFVILQPKGDSIFPSRISCVCIMYILYIYYFIFIFIIEMLYIV